jgi:hypothetical protein
MKLINLKDNNIVVKFQNKILDSNKFILKKLFLEDTDNYLVLKIYFLEEKVEHEDSEVIFIHKDNEKILELKFSELIQQSVLERKKNMDSYEMNDKLVNVYYCKFKYNGSSIIYLYPNKEENLNITYTCDISTEHKLYILETNQNCEFYFFSDNNFEKREMIKAHMDQKFVDAFDMFLDGNYYFSLCVSYILGGIVMNSPFVPIESFHEINKCIGEKFEQIIVFDKWSPECLEKILSITNTLENNIFFNFENLKTYRILSARKQHENTLDYTLEKEQENEFKKSCYVLKSIEKSINIILSNQLNSFNKVVFKKSQSIDETYKVFIENDCDNFLPEFDFYIRNKGDIVYFYTFRTDLYKGWEYNLKCKVLNVNTNEYRFLEIGKSDSAEKIIQVV